MDWNKEKEQLFTAEDRVWWKSTPGKHTIKFLNDGEEFSIEWEGEVIPKVRFKVEVNGNVFDWSVTKGKTQNSLYGQIALVGAARGVLHETSVTLIVKGTGKETSYIVEEALPLMSVKEEVVA